MRCWVLLFGLLLSRRTANTDSAQTNVHALKQALEQSLLDIKALLLQVRIKYPKAKL
jgi:hypothetical protein